MITLTGNSIIIPQGESGSISFGFKNQLNDDPIILSGEEGKHNFEIQVVVSDKLATESGVKFAKTYKLSESKDDNHWHVFATSKIARIDNIAENTQYLPNTLYKIVQGKTIVYKYHIGQNTITDLYKDGVGEVYDYPDSSITVQFDKNDTYNLPPKTYYLAIYLKDNDIIHTLLSPIDFIVKGALKYNGNSTY